MRQEGISEERIQYGKHLLALSIMGGQVFVFLEFICYIFLFLELRTRNKSLIEILKEDIVKKRAKKNAMTFVGQFITFLIEVAFTILMQVLIYVGKVGGFFEPGALPCAMVVTMAGITSSQILASPELRRFVQGYD